ncbi:MAG: helix-turn-helix domain-containing protein [Bilophila wadsworthia]
MEETETVLTLADFGALLRERRIHKGLTEENVAAELKITSRLVKAIEEGDMESMPHAVYARGFIRAYAKLLAVDDSVTHAACALLKDPEEELREQKSVLSPLRHVARKVYALACHPCARCFLREGHGIFGIVSPDFPAIR